MNEQCNICFKYFHEKYLDIHMKHMHRSTNFTVYKCLTDPSCNRVFPTKKSLRQHSVKSHNIPPIMKVELGSSIEGTQLDDTIDESLSDLTYEVNLAKIPEVKVPTDSELTTSAMEMISKLYADPSLARIQVNRVISHFHKFLNSNYFDSLKHSIKDCNSTEDKNLIVENFEKIQNTFDNLKTEHNRFKVLNELRCFIRPKPVYFGCIEEKGINGELKIKEVCGQIIPLNLVLQQFFELPDVFDQIHDYYLHLMSDNTIICNIIQTEFWKTKVPQASDKIIFPLFLYEDAFETGNPLGSHAGIYKLSGMYIQIPCVPPEFRSRLDNIFLAQIYHADDFKAFPRKTIYGQLICDLNALETEGIELSIKDRHFTVYFKVALILGDNLGLNSMLGFVESFNSNYSCRFCKISRQESSKLVRENPKLLRTKQNYHADVLKNDLGTTGIKELCIFNDLISFDVWENHCVDITHDLEEGVCRYEVNNLLCHCILQKKYFSLETLNWRIKFFNFGSQSNRPPLITPQSLKTKSLKMSAAEMQSFVLNASLIFGDLITDKSDEHWKLFKLLRKILLLSLLRHITELTPTTMASLVAKHHRLYIKLYGNTLKPKHHYMTHYPRIMKKVGPLRALSSIRFEAKHRPSKIYAGVTYNRINLCYSIAMKHQLHLSDVLLHNKSFIPTRITCKEDTAPLSFSEKLFLPDGRKNSIKLKHVSVNNVKYTTNSILLIRDEELPVFGLVEKIFCLKNDLTNVSEGDFILVVSQFMTVKYDDHLVAYIMGDLIKCESIRLNVVHDTSLYNIINMPNGYSYILYD